MNNSGHFTSSNLQFEIEQSLKPNQKPVATDRKRSAIKNIILASSSTMQSITTQNASQSFKISRQQFLEEFTEGIHNGGRDILGKRTDFDELDHSVPRSSKPGSSSTSMGSLSLIEPSEISLTLEVGQLQTQLKGKVCSLSALEANSFLKALSSPFESTKALLKHFLFEMITSETFDTATYNGLSTQVQELIISFCNTQLRGVRMPLSKHIDKQHVPLEDLFPASTTLSAQEYSSKKQLKLSVLLGCYLEGLKQQLAKTGKSADQEAAIQSLYSALYEGSNLSTDKDLKLNTSVSLENFKTFVDKLLARSLSKEETERAKEILKPKLLSKLKKLPQRPLKLEYQSAISSMLSSLIDDCHSSYEVVQSMQQGTSQVQVFLLSEICPECRRDSV